MYNLITNLSCKRADNQLNKQRLITKQLNKEGQHIKILLHHSLKLKLTESFKILNKKLFQTRKQHLYLNSKSILNNNSNNSRLQLPDRI